MLKSGLPHPLKAGPKHNSLANDTHKKPNHKSGSVLVGEKIEFKS